MPTLTSADKAGICERPCAKCPWTLTNTGERDYLRDGRREQIWDECASRDVAFFCHETVDYDVEEDDEPDTGRSHVCAGWLLASVRHEGPIPQTVRIAMRLGFDLDAWAESHAHVRIWEPPKVETCNTVGDNCIAPAGYASGGGAVRGTVAADCECDECGDAVCSECISDAGLCGDCAPWAEDDE